MPKSIGLQSSARSALEPARGECLSVPASARDMNPFEFPSSARLEGVFRRKGITRLGELDGLPLEELRQFGNCGPRTISELVHLLKRIGAGEFKIPADLLSPASLAGMLRKLEVIIDDLPEREREILLLRLGANKANQYWTLRKVGDKFGLTRERVRQVMELILPFVRKAGGPGLAAQLRAIASTCSRSVCPLTPALLAEWLEGAKAPLRYALPVHVRLLGELNPAIPSWPAGQEHRTDPRPGQQEIAVRVLRTILQQGEWRLPLKTAFKQTVAQGRLRGVSVAEFLAGLKHARGLVVEFPKPAQPKVRLRWLAATKAVIAILETSDRALTLNEIADRLRATFGPGMGDWSPGSVRRALTTDCYCLGRGHFGLRRHFKLPEALARKACSDVYQLLKKQARSISPFRIVTDRRFGWTAKTNGFELVELLREDPRFAEVRRFHFDLASRAATPQPAASPQA
jgi:hypothetical protein